MSQTSDLLKVTCPACASRMRVPSNAAGRRVRCPKCEKAFRIPEAKKTTDSLLELSDEPSRFPCDDCGTKLKAPSAAVGKRIKCRHCGSVMRVPDPQAPPPEVESDDETYGFGDGGGLLDELAASEASGSLVEDAGPTCPNCASPMQRGSVMCTSCGYNVQTGSRTSAVSLKPEPVESESSGFGIRLGWHPFMTGTLLSIGGALIGGVAWFLVAFYTQYEIGWLAWGMGLLAGGGMAVGYRDANNFAGLVAAIVACLGIVIAKIALFVVILLPLISMVQTGLGASGMSDVTPRDRLTTAIAMEYMDDSETSMDFDDPEAAMTAIQQELEASRAEAQREVDRMSDEEVKRELLVRQLAEDYVNNSDAWDDIDTDDDQSYEATYAQMKADARAKAEEEVDQLNATEITQRLAEPQRRALADARATIEAIEQDIDPNSDEYQQVYDQELANAQSLSPEEVDSQLAEASQEQLAALSGVMGAAAVVLFFVEMFGLFDILFFGLAVATAFQVGRAGA